MPNRTPEARKLIDSLPVIPPDHLCNARTPKGYCKNSAGYKTDHVGTGRCKYHGGLAGRPVVTGLYSSKLKSTIQEEYEQLVNDPHILELKSEFSFLKTVMLKFIENIQNELDDPSVDFWTVTDHNGNEIESPKSKQLFKIFASMSSMFEKINNAEQKKQEHLDLNDIHSILAQIRNVMDESCNACPVRAGVGEKLSKIKIPHKK